MRTMQVRFERLAGFPRGSHEITNVEFQALLIVEQLIEQEEIALKLKTQKLLMAAVGMKG